MIRLANIDDYGRVAEILVFNNRKYFYPIFKDINYSFKEFNVLDNYEWLVNDEKIKNSLYVYDDKGIIKGFIIVDSNEVIKLYVDTFFQNEGIGGKLLKFAIKDHQANHLWALEKNTNGIRFYNRYGFFFKGNKKLEEDTTEYLIELVRE